MKKGQIVEGFIERMDFPARGIGRIAADETLMNLSGTEEEAGRAEKHGERLVVKNALPGQRVRVRISKKRKGVCEGQLLEVVTPSPAEVPSDCPHFGACGGCLLRTLPYEEQLKLKETQVRSLLEQACENPHFEGIHASPVINGYRNKMEFSFGDTCKDGPLSLGMHKRGSFYDVVTAEECRIVDQDFRDILKAVLSLCTDWRIPYYHRMSHRGYLRHLLVRKGAKTGEILVDLITTTQWEEAFGEEEAFERALIQTLIALPLKGRLVGILHTRNDSVADTITNEGTALLWGRDHFFETLLHLTFRISPFSFFQTNSSGAELLYSIVREYAGETGGGEIFDLYSGTGTIAQILAPVADHVTGVEIVPEAVEAARENADRNGLSNCTFLAGDVLRVIDDLARKPDLIILDPPRDGIHPKALPKIIGFGVERIIYVSCKPTSLVRDLAVLQQAGYQVIRSCCVDLFPATANVETVCLLSNRKRKPDSYVKWKLDMEDYYRIKDTEANKER